MTAFPAPKKPPTKVIQITLPLADWKKVELAAAQERTPMSTWVVKQVQPAIDKLPEAQ